MVCSVGTDSALCACFWNKNFVTSGQRKKKQVLQGAYFSAEAGLKKEWFTELTDLEFEGHYFLAPADYDGWLSQEYGDYMKLPPEEKRTSHNTASYYKF